MIDFQAIWEKDLLEELLAFGVFDKPSDLYTHNVHRIAMKISGLVIHFVRIELLVNVRGSALGHMDNVWIVLLICSKDLFFYHSRWLFLVASEVFIEFKLIYQVRHYW